MRKKKITKTPDIIEFATDPQILGLSISPAQETLLRGMDGLPLTSDEQRQIWELCTGGREYREGHFYPEVVEIAGARSGKDSRGIAVDACYGAAFGGHEKHLSKGERGIIANVAQDQRGTGVSASYIRDYFTDSPVLRAMVDEVLTNEIRLTNRLAILSFPNTKESIRGWSIPRGYMNQIGFWRLEGSANADNEIQTSIRRGMIAFPKTRLMKCSTPYMKSGVLYDDFKGYFGKDNSDVLVWRAPSALMNPALKSSRLEREQRLDPQRFAREYLAEFAEDLDTFIPTAWVEAAIVQGRRELPPVAGVAYAAGSDTSGLGSGSNADSFTVSICHSEGDRVIQDVARGWKKSRGGSVDLAGIVADIARTLKAYNLSEVVGDRYGAQWVVEAFVREGISYRQSDQDKSFYYLAIEPLFAQGHIEILDHAQLERELRSLERRPQPGGKIKVDHPRGMHDDYSNSLAIAAAIAFKGAGSSVDQFLENNRDLPDNRITSGGEFLFDVFSTDRRRGPPDLW